jgi:hypothetical protein
VVGVATVLVRAQLLRRPRVDRGRWRWVGTDEWKVIRRRILARGRTFLTVVIIIGGMNGLVGIPIGGQMSLAAAMSNVSAH